MLCNGCHVNDPACGFSPSGAARKRCRNCHASYMRGWASRNSEKVSLQNKQYKTKDGGRAYSNSHLKTLYGITIERYEEMEEAQGGACAICGNAESAKHQNGKVRKLAVDHCHDTGEVRGLLCHSCNTGIGSFDHDSLLLRSAINYLERQ